MADLKNKEIQAGYDDLLTKATNGSDIEDGDGNVYLTPIVDGDSPTFGGGTFTGETAFEQNLSVGGVGTGRIFWDKDKSGDPFGIQRQIDTSGTAIWIVPQADDSYRVGIDRSTSPSYTLDVNGVVAQSGTPIVESGSNSDGSWVKYADGTMICRMTNLTMTYANEFQIRVPWTFPQAFNASPTVTHTPNDDASFNRIPAGLRDDVIPSQNTKSSTSIRVALTGPAGTFSSGDSNDTDAVAIGTWK